MQQTAAAVKGAAVAWHLSRSLPIGLPAEDVMLALVSPEAFWLLREWRKQAFGAQESMRRVLDSTREDIKAMAAEHPVLRGAMVRVRSKGLWSTFHKTTVRQKNVHDVLAVRVVVRGSDEDSVYQALDSIRSIYPSKDPARFKDYVARPKPNGYQGLHDTLLLPNGQAFEIQIRNERMDLLAEVGTAAHRKYKQGITLLAHQMLSGMASGMAAAVPDGRGNVSLLRWPLRPLTALALATRLAAGKAQ